MQKKKGWIIALCCLLFSSAFVTGRSSVPQGVVYPDSLSSSFLYTEGIKSSAIQGDTLRARQLLAAAIARDSNFAPAYYELASNLAGSDIEQAITLCARAHTLDTANKWYLQFYGQLLVVGKRYDKALEVYRTLTQQQPKDIDNYRLLAALYDQVGLPFSAISTLDSAEVRFGHIPMLSAMKRRMLIDTRQIDKAVTEAKTLVEAVPYEAENRLVLGNLYSAQGKDSLAMVEFAAAMQIDSTDVATLISVSEYYNRKQNFQGFLALSKRLFEHNQVSLEEKIKQFEIITSDMRFYRDFFFQINELASILAIKYPSDSRVVELYAKHLIASGELPKALDLYKLHTHDLPPRKEYFLSIIDIESYLQHPDSVNLYVNRALTLFPDNVEFHLAKGHVLSYAKEHGKAIEAYRNSLPYITTDSLRGLLWGYIGDTHHQQSLQGSTAKAMKACYKAYDKSLRYYKDNPMVLNNYAYFLSQEKRDLERALEMSSRAIALTPSNPTYLDTYAWVLFQLGRAAEAKKQMQQAISLDRQNSPELQLHYGDILAALGEKFMAEVYWRKARDNGYDAKEIQQRIDSLKSN